MPGKKCLVLSFIAAIGSKYVIHLLALNYGLLTTNNFNLSQFNVFFFLSDVITFK